jgi:hypothetical protein
MLTHQIEDQMQQILNEMGANPYLIELIERAHSTFNETLDEKGVCLEQPDEISDEIFRAFVSKCESTKIDDSELHLLIAFLRIALVKCGRRVDSLTALRAPRKRKRVSNGPNGRYRFELV